MNPAPDTPAWRAFQQWPHDVPPEVLAQLADERLVHSLEHGPAAQWRGWQSHRLGEFLGWLNQTPAWREWLAPIARGGAWHALPVMRRTDYREKLETVPPHVPSNFGQLAKAMTSGSSGVPIEFSYSELARRVNRSTFHADHQRQGRDVRATMASITTHKKPIAGSHLDQPGDPWMLPGRQLVRDASPYTLEENARWLCEHPARYLVTYPTLLSGMLSMIEQHGLKAPQLEQVVTFTETVDAELRERTRRLLGARITDRYSCEELGPMAFQCPHSDEHYHVAVSNVLVEVVDAQGQPLPPGTQGSILATGLHQWASPALRYELGDVGTLLPHCPACGVQVPVLTRLLGRRRVLVERPDGELFFVRILARDWLESVPAVREWRLVQTSVREFRFEFSAPHPLDEAEQAGVRAILARRVGPEFMFELMQLAQVIWPPGRKRQEVVGLAGLQPGG